MKSGCRYTKRKDHEYGENIPVAAQSQTVFDIQTLFPPEKTTDKRRKHIYDVFQKQDADKHTCCSDYLYKIHSR